jgi:hypothetical protein
VSVSLHETAGGDLGRAGETGDGCRALGSRAELAGLRSIHSYRTAAAKVPDGMAWICRIVVADIGRH